MRKNEQGSRMKNSGRFKYHSIAIAGIFQRIRFIAFLYRYEIDLAKNGITLLPHFPLLLLVKPVSNRNNRPISGASLEKTFWLRGHVDFLNAVFVLNEIIKKLHMN